MIENYVKTASRNMLRHRGYSFITIAGLAIGMACSFLILMWAQDELGYDRFNENINDLYRVAIEDHDNNEVVHIAVTPAPLAPTLKDEFPEIRRATRFANGQMVMKYEDKVFDESGVVYADADLLEMFTFPLAEGDPASALSDPHSIIVTEEMSEKYFGDEDPIGKVLTINGKTEFTVSAVARDIPYNSSIRFDFLAPFEYLRESADIDYWGAYRYYTFVQLAPGCMPDEVDEKMAGVCSRHQQESEDYLYLQPVKDIHLYSSLSYDNFGQADIKYVWILTALAVFVLLIACINFMNLTTARSATRAKEVGVRKAIGARRSDLVWQFLGESVLMSFIALLLAVGLVELLLPAFNEL
jgi:putative ABC transport system permease protein